MTAVGICHSERKVLIWEKQSRLPRRLCLLAKTPSPQPLSPKGRGAWWSHGVDFHPLAAPSSTEKLGDFSEDCLRIENPSSAAAQLFEAAQETSGSGVAFSFPYFFWLSKRNRVASRARATICIRCDTSG